MWSEKLLVYCWETVNPNSHHPWDSRYPDNQCRHKARDTCNVYCIPTLGFVASCVCFCFNIHTSVQTPDVTLDTRRMWRMSVIARPGDLNSSDNQTKMWQQVQCNVHWLTIVLRCAQGELVSTLGDQPWSMRTLDAASLIPASWEWARICGPVQCTDTRHLPAARCSGLSGRWRTNL